MRHPREFGEVDLTVPFFLSVEEVMINGVGIGPVELNVFYDARGKTRLSFEIDNAPCLTASDCRIEVKYKSSDEPIEVVPTRLTNELDTNRAKVEGILARTPFVLAENQDALSFEAVLLKSPRIFSKKIELVDDLGNSYSIVPFSAEDDGTALLRSNLKLCSSDPHGSLRNLRFFLTFVRGSYCGIGNLFAYGEEDRLACRWLGFSPTDIERRETNWYDYEIQDALPEIFTLFCEANTDDLTERAMMQAINFYRASNASRQVSVEMAIIAAHSALEAVANYILEHLAGWKNSLLRRQSGIEFADKNRAAAKFFGVSGDLLSESPELQRFSKSRNGLDAFEVISFVRNALVHQNPKASLTGIQLHETWLLAQWLVEVMVFGMIGYRGTIIDRRVYHGWRGTTCKLPITR